MIEYIIEQTDKYINTIPKDQRKQYGQFFTSRETAVFMSDLFSFPKYKKVISILDPGAGTGILSCALIERIQNCNSNISRIELTCFENDKNILNILKENLEFMKKNSKIDIVYKIVIDNYITSQSLDFNNSLNKDLNLVKYDYVIGNPPYMKISKNSNEAVSMSNICYGTPNLYFLFASMSLFNLNNEGEMVYIIPRSWTSGVYFKKFREYLFTYGKIEHIHLFVSRNKVFEKEKVLQETMIIKVKKTNKVIPKITITSSQSNSDFSNMNILKVPYNIIVSGKDKYVYLVTNQKEIDVLKKMRKYDNTLLSIGLKMKTGLTVDFRNKDILCDERTEGAIPLFYSQHIKEGIVEFPIHKEHEYISTKQTGLMQKNNNYLFIKRFTAKEEKRRLQCGIYLSKRYSDYETISTQNKLNFIDGLSIEMSECLVYGLYALFNSRLYDSYYRILNGSTQVNSTEINSMPVPTLNIIQTIGRKLMKSQDLSESNCDKILEEYYV